MIFGGKNYVAEWAHELAGSENLVTTDATVALDSTGSGSVSFAPRSGQRWTVLHVGIKTTGTVKTSICNMTKTGRFICGSSSGDLDSADGAPVPLRDSDTLTLTWSGADANAIATATIIYELEFVQ